MLTYELLITFIFKYYRLDGTITRVIHVKDYNILIINKLNKIKISHEQLIHIIL